MRSERGVGFPSIGDRLEILQSSLQKAAGAGLPVSEDSFEALQRIASSDQAEALTGADLAAMISSAQLAVATRVYSAGASSRIEAGSDEGITKEDLWSALYSTRPTVHPGERRRFDALYKKYRGENRNADSNFPKAPDQHDPGVNNEPLRTALK